MPLRSGQAALHPVCHSDYGAHCERGTRRRHVSDLADRLAQEVLLVRLASLEIADNGSAAHHQDSVTHFQGFRVIRSEHEDPYASFQQLVHDLIDLTLAVDIDATAGLIEDQHLIRDYPQIEQSLWEDDRHLSRLAFVHGVVGLARLLQ